MKSQPKNNKVEKRIFCIACRRCLDVENKSGFCSGCGSYIRYNLFKSSTTMAKRVENIYLIISKAISLAKSESQKEIERLNKGWDDTYRLKGALSKLTKEQEKEIKDLQGAYNIAMEEINKYLKLRESINSIQKKAEKELVEYENKHKGISPVVWELKTIIATCKEIKGETKQ